MVLRKIDPQDEAAHALAESRAVVLVAQAVQERRNREFAAASAGAHSVLPEDLSAT
jgi:hypothetical protein